MIATVGGNGGGSASGNTSGNTPKEGYDSTNPPGILRDPTLTPRRLNTDIPNILPHERVFPIQIGSELFRLSGASISSDAPSYFSQFFNCQLKQAENEDEAQSFRTLYIDRDPVTFKDISLHLQGYNVQPRDASHFVKLFADAQFYSLPRLISQLYEESIYITIGGIDFRIPHDLFSDPGNSPNYFSLGFAVFFFSPREVFPGLNREGLLRPPSILPPSVPHRSAHIFSEILHLLRGYPLEIRSPEHRKELLRDCRYFHFKGLEQKLVPHDISFNLSRQRSEITLRLSDIRQSGISISADPTTNDPFLIGWVNYARPFADDRSYELVLEIGAECLRLHRHGESMRAEFFGDGKTRISRLFEVVATKLNLPSSVQPLGLLMKNGGAGSAPASPGNTPLSEDRVRCIVGEEASVTADGREWSRSLGSPVDDERTGGSETSSVIASSQDTTPTHIESFESATPQAQPLGTSKKRKRNEALGGNGPQSWIVRTSQWRLRVQGSGNGRKGVECVLVAVKIDALSGELGRNSRRAFLGD